MRPGRIILVVIEGMIQFAWLVLRELFWFELSQDGWLWLALAYGKVEYSIGSWYSATCAAY